MSGPSGDYDPRLRLRLWIDGELVDDTWIDTSDPEAEQLVDAAGRRQLALRNQAEVAGSRWLIETYDPAAPEGEAYVRFGSDTAGMVDPLAMCPFCGAKVAMKPGVDEGALLAKHWAESPSCGHAWAGF